MSDCIFCKIAAKTIPSKIVHEDDKVVAFDDVNPQAPTHVLLIPRKHVASIAEMNEADAGLLGHLMLTGHKIAKQKGIAEGGYRFVVNTGKDPKEIRAKLKAKPSQKVFTVDATRIAIETIGRPMPNSSMLGAVNKATEIVALDVLLEDVKGSFGKKFAQKIIDGNLAAVKRGYEEVKQG